MVDEKEMESDDEYEEKEILVLVDLKGIIDSDFLSQTPFERFKIIGLETDNPVLQLNNYHFTGEYDETLGTALLFQEDDESEESDTVFSNTPAKRLKFAYRTSKLLNMRRVFITETKEDQINHTEELDSPSDSTADMEDTTVNAEETNVAPECT
ncbi:UNVERIFIED_CONTAM: hypothetical protein RMT77_009031 [Armadillidium vulgare]